MPTEYIPSVEARLPRCGCQKGAKYGFPCVDVQATLLDGKAHDVDSSADTFKLAAIECFRDAQAKAGLMLLEPIMNVVVHAPAQYQGDLTRDINRRRGEILNPASDKGRCMLHAYVPLAELFGYTSELRNFTSGTASFTHGAEPLRAGQGRAGRPARGELKKNFTAENAVSAERLSCLLSALTAFSAVKCFWIE